MTVVFEDYFNKSGGKPFKYKGKEIKMSDKIILFSKNVNVKVTFLSVRSEWRQGIVLQTKGNFEVNGQIINHKVVLWEHTAPKEVELIVKSKDQMLFIYNVWNIGDGVMHYGHNGGALFTEYSNDGSSIIYYCNDGKADDDFDDLIFKLEYQ